MNDPRLPTADSATGRGLKSGVYATLSAFLVFATGLIAVLNNVPGCSEAVIDYLRENALQIALIIGVPTGLFSFVVNLLRPSVRKY